MYNKYNYSYYPKWVYSPREDITRQNMKTYDKMKNEIYKKALELNPDYYNLGLRERQEILEKAEGLIGYHL